MHSTIKFDEVRSQYLPAPVAYGVLKPDSEEKLPLCIFLLGAGGTRESLIDLQPVFDGWWSEHLIPPMMIATPTSNLDYYMEEPDGTVRWDSFFTTEFVPHLKTTYKANETVGVTGISGGGYGALKFAFAKPSLFSAVAAMQPMLEPGLHESEVGARNRLHHSAGGPQQLIGLERDGDLWEANNPANRARANGEAIRKSGLAIYLEAADNDFLNAHDGAEFLHRVLWDLDISHEYRLMRNADHGGVTMRARLRAMFEWLGSVWAPARLDTAVEASAAAWLQSGMQGKPPAGATTTNAFIQSLRASFEPLREQAAEIDSTTRRRYGVLGRGSTMSTTA